MQADPDRHMLQAAPMRSAATLPLEFDYLPATDLSHACGSCVS